MTVADATQKSMDAGSPGRLWLRPLVAGLMYSLLTALAFAPFDVWPLALIAPAPLLWIGWQTGGRDRPSLRLGRFRRLGQLVRRRAVATWLGSAAGVLPLWLYEVQWTIDVSRLGYVPMSVTLALLVGLAPALLAVARRGLPAGAIAWAGPIIWAGAEVFRGEVFFTGYPWLLAAHPLIEAPGLPAMASVVGVYGLGAAVVAPICLALAPGTPLVRSARAAGALALIVALGFGAGALTPAPSDRSIRVAVVQTNVPQDNKTGWQIEQRVRDMERLVELTRQASVSDPDLIAWPETMFPGFTLEPDALALARAAGLGQDSALPDRPRIEAAWFADELLRLQRAIDIPMLVGAIALEGLRADPVAYDAQYNSAYLVHRGRIEPERYDKVHLTPFGEVMPYISAIPALQQALLDLAAAGMPFTLSAGDRPHGLSVPIGAGPVRIATPICFEAASASTCRRIAAAPRADLLFNLTNDGWFGDFDPARIQAAQVARWRAVELATPMVRAANTGISGAFDHRGRPIPGRFAPDGQTGRRRVAGVLVVDVLLGAGRPTLFARGGWIAQWALFGAAGLLVIVGLRGARASKRSTNPPPGADEL